MAITTGFCPDIQRDVDRYFNEGCLTQEPNGFLDMLVSPENTAGFEQIPTQDASGHVHNVRLITVPQLDPTVAITAEPDLCTTTREKDPVVKVIDTFNQRYSEDYSISDADYRKFCSDFQYRAKLMEAMLNQLNASLNRALVADMNTKFGQFYNSASTQQTVYILKADDSSNPAGMSRALNEYRKLGCPRKPLLVGGGNIDIYTINNEIGCCNDQGMQTNLANGQFFYYRDWTTDTLWGSNEFGLFVPGSVQLVTRNQFLGDLAIDGDILHQGVITDPRTGLLYDFKMVYNYCGGARSSGWRMYVGIDWALEVIPDLYTTGDPRKGCNGTLNFIGDQLP